MPYIVKVIDDKELPQEMKTLEQAMEVARQIAKTHHKSSNIYELKAMVRLDDTKIDTKDVLEDWI